MKVVVTGGATVAPIDDVRFIANVSSGRFSASITEACLRRGATVWHVYTPSASLPFRRSAEFDLDTADPIEECERLEFLRRDWRAVRDRLRLVPIKPGRVTDYASAMERLLGSERIDVAFLAMAVSDFEPEPVFGKINSSAEELIIRCKKTSKVIRSLKDWAPEIYLAGFKLVSGVTTSELIRQAELACQANRADLTVANDLTTLREGRHTVHLVRPGHEPETLGPDENLADLLVKRVLMYATDKKARPQ